MKTGKYSVSSALPRIASQQAEVRAGHFSEGVFDFSKTYNCGSATRFEKLRARKTRSEHIRSVQTSQNELAEPF